MDASVRQGLKASFLIIAAMMAAMIGRSFLLNSFDPHLAVLSRIAPTVPGHHCLLCGMTHSFMAISRGDFGQAVAANPGGPMLYFFFCLAAVGGLVVIFRDYITRHHRHKA
ncbi:MAG: DUF2752 domain-containing protein [Patescibacteria group bacterium]|jgi:hypothetical protein